MSSGSPSATKAELAIHSVSATSCRSFSSGGRRRAAAPPPASGVSASCPCFPSLGCTCRELSGACWCVVEGIPLPVLQFAAASGSSDAVERLRMRAGMADFAWTAAFTGIARSCCALGCFAWLTAALGSLAWACAPLPACRDVLRWACPEPEGSKTCKFQLCYYITGMCQAASPQHLVLQAGIEWRADYHGVSCFADRKQSVASMPAKHLALARP